MASKEMVLDPGSDVKEVITEMMRQLRELKAGRANLDVVGKSTGVANAVVKAYSYILHSEMFALQKKMWPKELETDALKEIE